MTNQPAIIQLMAENPKVGSVILWIWGLSLATILGLIVVGGGMFIRIVEVCSCQVL